MTESRYITPFLLIFFLAFNMESSAQQTPFERQPHTTATYHEVIAHYQQLAAAYPQARLLSYGSTDFGKPLHLLVLARDKEFDPLKIRNSHKTVLLINNGIHPGEPEGIDASMMLARDLLKKNAIPDNVVICIIPVYNIDGIFNRTGTSRANQNGPDAYGFRGNSKNYDLNRDFIKTDSRNSQTFQQIFNIWQPEVFVDTHTSNGADYQYTMTLIPTHKDKLQKTLSAYLTRKMIPSLYADMKKVGYEMIPYVNSIEESPDAGITGFLESPRYSTGYAALHNTIGFMPETHMLKAYDKRVDATYKLLETYVDLVSRDAAIIRKNKIQADLEVAAQQEFDIEWKLNKEQAEPLEFKGYAAKEKTSEVSGFKRLYYDRAAPYTKNINYWNNFVPSVTISKPIAYIIPKAWERIVELLKLNKVKVQQLAKDTQLPVEMYYIGDFKTSSSPYEGHYLHSAVQLQSKQQNITFYEGDYIVYVDQTVNRYIIETLEPQATDSFFNWNFFDSILSMKEHFSAYVFEDTAAELLRKDPALREKLEQKKAGNADFAKDGSAQLDFVYKNSEYYESTHLRYPIARLINNTPLSIK
ncbi:hypothetical protein PBAL39_10686 [Pedobacter sp. BAL39]|uniref:M14 family metallopeptidase n=1 Tax=Pedobacter sp. BAL39 TaxID=391596 RepID=UPI00015598F5|nr:M14 family metallopeptidase [Pedobacter sp. BAL39]EDM37605.1 hypothetical protein PBAL39_10686 [Pedobacter sp. BAL39]